MAYTIDNLNALAQAASGDELPIWDVSATGNEEPTKKITLQNLAAAIKTLASLLGTGDVVNDLTIDDATGTNPAGQHEVYLLAQNTASDWRSLTQYLSTLESDATSIITYTGKVRTITFQGVTRVHAENDILMTLPPEHRPYLQANNYFSGNIGATSVVVAINGLTGNVSIYTLNGATTTARLYFSATYITS